MGIEVTARHMEAVHEDLQEEARARAAKLVEEFPEVENVHVILDHEKHRCIAEMVVQARHHVRIEAAEASENMRASMDAAQEKVERQLRKVREKSQEHRTAMKHFEQKRQQGE